MPGMVLVSSGGQQWSGVMISSDGRILTSSAGLGAAPLADFSIGTVSGQAWVIGRDDNLDLALLEVITPQTTYPTVTLRSAPGLPLINEQFTLLQFSSLGATLGQFTTSVLSLRPDGNGIQYAQVQALPAVGSQGGAMVDGHGEVRGLRMSSAQMMELFGAVFGEWVMESQALANQLVPRLASGVSIVDPVPTTCNQQGATPQQPAVIRGNVSSNGVSLASGSKVYARVRGGGVEEWFVTTVTDRSPGRYFFSIGTCTPALRLNATVEFWYNRTLAPQTSPFVHQTNRELPLTFG